VLRQGVKIPLDEVAVGDKIMFREPSSFENRKMKVGDVDYWVISVNDILAKIA
jgi:co-chaperonin GroES (HSP10)